MSDRDFRTAKKPIQLRLPQRVIDFYRNGGKGHITRMQAILERYVKDHIKGLPNGGPALITAIIDHDMGRIQRLISAGADPNTTDHSSHTVLSWAVYFENIKIIMLLLGAGADPNCLSIEPGLTLLMQAVSLDNKRIVGALIAAGANLDTQSAPDGKTALMYAAQLGRHHIVEMLLAAGAAPNKRNRDGNAALDLAQQHGHIEVAHVLSRATQISLVAPQEKYDPHRILKSQPPAQND